MMADFPNVIKINYIGGSYGNFVSKVLTMSFNQGIVMADQSQFGTHDHYVIDSSLKVGFTPCHCYFNSDQLALFHPFTHSKTFNPTTITITYDSVIEKSLLLYNWYRSADLFPFSPSDLIRFKTKQAIDLQYQSLPAIKSQCTDEAQHRLTAWRNQSYEYVLNMLENDQVTELGLINNWGHGSGLFVSNDAWVKQQPNLIALPLLSLFNTSEFSAFLTRLSNAIDVPVVTDGNALNQTLSEFRENQIKRGLPNLELVQEAFTAVNTRKNRSLKELTLSDKILLTIMLRLHSNIRFHIRNYPENTIEFYNLIKSQRTVARINT